MTAVKNAIFVTVFTVVVTDVTSWIVDMAEVERILADKQHFDEVPNYDERHLLGVSGENDNEVMYTANYAEDFNYQIFKRKEVENVMKNGGVYLDGLSNAMAAYRDTLDDCTRNSSKVPPGARKPISGEELTRCEKAEKKKLYVQNLSEMALLTTDKLKNTDYEKIKQDDSNEETDLIQLAWTLDRLAYLTGYGSRPGDHVETSSRGDIQDNSPTLTTETTEKLTTENIKQQDLEILEQVENGRPLMHLPPKSLTDVKDVQKRDTGDVMRYYLKYKVWNGSNPTDDYRTNENDEFDVQNSLKVVPIRKRSITDKKAANMLSVLPKTCQRCKLKERSKTPVRKLVKSIKVYRRKILNNSKTFKNI